MVKLRIASVLAIVIATGTVFPSYAISLNLGGVRADVLEDNKIVDAGVNIGGIGAGASMGQNSSGCLGANVNANVGNAIGANVDANVGSGGIGVGVGANVGSIGVDVGVGIGTGGGGNNGGGGDDGGNNGAGGDRTGNLTNNNNGASNSRSGNSSGGSATGSFASLMAMCSGGNGDNIVKLIANTDYSRRAMSRWSRASNVEVIPMQACREVRAKLARALKADQNINALWRAIQSDALISASLERTSYNPSQVFAVRQNGRTLSVYVY